MKKIFTFLFSGGWSSKKITIKDMFFTDNSENIIRTIKTIKKMSPELTGNIFDIGAFDGETAKAFSKAFPQSTVIALEANPVVFEKAKQNCSSFPQIKMLNLAASDTISEREINITNNDVSSSLEDLNTTDKNYTERIDSFEVKSKVVITTTTLDDLHKREENQKNLLLKIDTQGHELEVLSGATQMLQKTEFVLVEMANHDLYKNGTQYYQVDDFMRNNGFKLFDIIITYRKRGIQIFEYDALYINKSLLNE